MSELSTPNAGKNTQCSGTYLPLFLFLSPFLISKIACFLPYLLNLLHFIYPLLITTFLVFLFTSRETFIEKNAGENEKEDHHEVYKIFFEAASQFELQQQHDGSEESLELVDKFLICVSDATEDRNPPPEKTSEELFQEKDQSCETVSGLHVVLSEDEKEINTDYSKNVIGVSKEELETDIKESVSTTLLQDKGRKAVVSEIQYEEMSMMSYRSVSVDKEWKRTLACKLFEERHNNNGSAGVEGDEEGMDLLWEAYEENSSSAKHTKGEKKKKRLVGSIESSRYKDMDAVDDDEDDVVIGKICCLQALKFSSGKVNFGVGRPNIGRISKAFRGMGWLRRVSSKKGSSPLKPKVLSDN